MIKRLAFLLIIITIAIPINVCATDGNYLIKDLQLSVSIPEKYHVALYPVRAPNSFLDITGMSASELNSYFQGNKIYLNSLTEDLAKEIIVYSNLEELNGGENADTSLMQQVSEEDLTGATLEKFKDLVAQAGFRASDVTFYDHKQTKFMKTHLFGTIDGIDTYSDVYFTFHNGKAIYVALKSYGEPISEIDRANEEQTIDSIVFYSDNGNPLPQTDNERGGSMLDNFIIGAASAAVLIIVFNIAKWVSDFFHKKRNK